MYIICIILISTVDAVCSLNVFEDKYCVCVVRRTVFDKLVDKLLLSRRIKFCIKIIFIISYLFLFQVSNLQTGINR